MPQITVIDSRHIHANEYSSIGGVGGYNWQPETTVVEWSDGTCLVVEEYRAEATYKGQTYQLRQFSTLHDTVVDHWTAAITKRLQKDMPMLVERVRGGIKLAEASDLIRNWSSELPTPA